MFPTPEIPGRHKATLRMEPSGHGTWTDVQEQQKVQEGAWSELEGGSREELRGKARMTMRITTLTATTMLHWMGAAV